MKSTISYDSRRRATAAFASLVLVSSSFLHAQVDPADPAAAPTVDPRYPYPAGQTAEPVTTREVAPEGAKSCEELIGQKVVGQNGEELGTIDDLIIERESGKIEYALISSGGFLGIADTLRAVPISELEPRANEAGDEIAFGLPLDKARFKQAPTFADNDSALHGLDRDDEGQRIQDFYSAAADGEEIASSSPSEAMDRAEEDNGGERESVAASTGRFARVSELVGRTVRNDREEIGEIEEFATNAEHDTVVAVVAPDIDFADSRTTRVAIPLNHLTARGDGAELTADLTREDFMQAEPANESDPFSGDRPVYQWEVREIGGRANDVGRVDDNRSDEKRPAAIGS